MYAEGEEIVLTSYESTRRIMLMLGRVMIALKILSALKENERVLNSIEGKLKKFQASFQSLSSDLLDGNLVKGIIDIGSAALDMADGFVKAGDAIPTLITAFSGVATLMGTKAGVIMPFYVVGIAA